MQIPITQSNRRHLHNHMYIVIYHLLRASQLTSHFNKLFIFHGFFVFRRFSFVCSARILWFKKRSWCANKVEKVKYWTKKIISNNTQLNTKAKQSCVTCNMLRCLVRLIDVMWHTETETCDCYGAILLNLFDGQDRQTFSEFFP